MWKLKERYEKLEEILPSTRSKDFSKVEILVEQYVDMVPAITHDDETMTEKMYDICAHKCLKSINPKENYEEHLAEAERIFDF